MNVSRLIGCKDTLYNTCISDKQFKNYCTMNKYHTFDNDSYDPDRLCWSIDNRKELNIKGYRSYYILRYASRNRLPRERIKDYC